MGPGSGRCHHGAGVRSVGAVVAGARGGRVAFTFWHPDLVTLHVWLWYHNPSGLYNGTNPLVQAYA